MAFEEELKKAISGEIYQKYGFDQDPFTPIPKKKIESFVNRENELKQIARAIANLTQGEIIHIPILGHHGVGKTHFLYYVHSGVSASIKELGLKQVFFIEGVQNFKDTFGCPDNTTEFNIRNCEFILNLNSDTSKVVLFIDDLDIIFNRMPKVVSDLMEIFKGGIIGTWDPRAWNAAKHTPYTKIPKTEVIFLHPFSKEHCEEILTRRINHSKNSEVAEQIFPKFVIEKLAIISDGNPYKLTTQAKKYFNFMMNKQLINVNEEIFGEFSKDIGVAFVADLNKKINQLTDRQSSVLRYIIEKIEVNAKDLADFLGTTRVGAVQHLHTLRDLDLLESKPKDRTVIFYVPNTIVEEIDSFLLKKEEGNEVSSKK